MARRIVAQDDEREKRLRDLFNLVRPPGAGRHGIDGILTIDGREIEFELKSVTTKNGSVSTVRDLGRDHIRKWKHIHWIVGFWIDDELADCRYGSPDDTKAWIDDKWEYARPDFEMAQLVPGLVTIETMFKIIGKKDPYTPDDARRLHKDQFTTEQYRAYMDQELGYSPQRMLEIFKERVKYVICQTDRNVDPRSASNLDPSIA